MPNEAINFGRVSIIGCVVNGCQVVFVHFVNICAMLNQQFGATRVREMNSRTPSFVGNVDVCVENEKELDKIILTL